MAKRWSLGTIFVFAILLCWSAPAPAAGFLKWCASVVLGGSGVQNSNLIRSKNILIRAGSAQPTLLLYRGSEPLNLPPSLTAFLNEATGAWAIVSVQGLDHLNMLSYIPEDGEILGGTRYLSAGRNENSRSLKKFAGGYQERLNFKVELQTEAYQVLSRPEWTPESHKELFPNPESFPEAQSRVEVPIGRRPYSAIFYRGRPSEYQNPDYKYFHNREANITAVVSFKEVGHEDLSLSVPEDRVIMGGTRIRDQRIQNSVYFGSLPGPFIQDKYFDFR